MNSLANKSKRTSAQLTLREVCSLLDEEAALIGSEERWVSPATGKPGKNDIRRLRRRMRQIEATTKERVLFGNSRLWTTWGALRRAGLIDTAVAAAGMVAEAVAELRKELAAMDEHQVHLGLLAARHEAAIARIEKRLALRR